MNDETDGGVHWSFWAIGVGTLIWNLMGVMNFFMQTDPDMLATYPESHRALIETQPVWSAGGFVLSVFGGAIGCLLILFRKSAATYLFIAALLGTIAVMAHTLSSGISFSAFDIVLTIVMPLVVAAFLVWYSKWVERKGWIS
ncbi:MAG: hypothetical protein HQ494_01295 [Rhodospirillales bacterium]|nr:hypothetical protein [Rhodospirillales bacterium]